MRLSSDGPAELLYCLNVFPDTSPAGFRRDVLPGLNRIQSNLAPGRAMGLGLRFSADELKELEDPGVRRDWLDQLQENQFYGVTFNAFPFGVFHGERVKERVYAPDWRSSERLDYTLQAARLLAESMPESVTGSISTVPGSYGAWVQTAADREAITHHLMDCVFGLYQLEEETGRRIHLGLEPEPDGFLETTPQCIAYWKEILFRSGADRLAAISGQTRAEGEAWIRRYLGVCFDTCHLAIQFEDLADSVRALQAEGILLSKVHISAALDVTPTERTLAALREYDEPVYLHQVRQLDAEGNRRGWPDLGPALESVAPHEDSRLRVHFHVPLDWEGTQDFQSTAAELTPQFLGAAVDAGCEHFEVETYTFDVLPDALRRSDLPGMMLRELRWFQSLWEKSLER